MGAGMIARKLHMARTLASHRDDIGPLIDSAQRLWEKVTRGEYDNLGELKTLVEATMQKLTFALHNLQAMDQIAVPVANLGNGSTIKNVGETGKH